MLAVIVNKQMPKQRLTEEETIYLKSQVDNTTPAYEKITQTYEYSSLLAGSNYLMENIEPECVRYNNGIFYFIYKTENGYFFKPPHYGTIWNEWRFIDKVYIDDFVGIKKGKTTMEEIRAIDEYANYVTEMSSRPPFSIHFTVDGYKIVIYYTKKDGTWIVDKIRKYKGRKNPIYYNLLPIDKELLE